jgi:hypothetical protein
MTTFYGSTIGGTVRDAGATRPFDVPHGSLVNAKLRCTTEIITFASQASGSDFPVAVLPIGATFAGIELCLDTSSGSATLAFGVSGSTAKFAAAAALTATDTPTKRGKASAMDDVPATAEQVVLLTTGGAALPSSGVLVVKTYFTVPA